VSRGLWTLSAAVLMLAGLYGLVHGLDPAAYLVIGVGLGIVCAVVGSLIHDALAGRPGL